MRISDWSSDVCSSDLRILDPSSAQLGIDALGYEPEQKDAYMKALAQPQGMILVTGPTGSGKTVSLYTGLNILNTDDINISTAEDPAAITLHGVHQVNDNPRVGLTRSDKLRVGKECVSSFRFRGSQTHYKKNKIP